MSDHVALTIVLALAAALIAVVLVAILDRRRGRRELARVRGEADQCRRDAATAVAQRNALSGLGRGIAGGDLAGFVVEAVVEILGADAACLFQFTSSHARLIASAGPGAIHETSRTFNVPLHSDPLMEAIVASGGPIHARSYAVSDELRFQYLAQRFVGGAGVPVQGEAGVAGALIVHLGRDGPELPSDWSETLAAFSDLVLLANVIPTATEGLLSGTAEDVFGRLPIPIAIHDESMVWTYANPASVEIHGDARSEFVGRPVAALLFPPTYDMHDYLIRTRATDAIAFSSTWRNRRAAPATVVVVVRTIPIHTSRGMLLLMMSSEITDEVAAERRRIRHRESERQAHARAEAATRDALRRLEQVRAAHQSLHEEHGLVSAALDLASDWVVAIDPAGHALLLNDAARDCLGMPGDTAVGMHVDDLFAEETAKALATMVRDIREHDRATALSVRMVRDERSADFIWTVGPYSVGGHVRGVVGVAREQAPDVDRQDSLDLALARKQAAQAYASRALGDAEQVQRRRKEVDASKDEILALISHDLRTPLTSILGYTDLLLGERAELDSRHRRFVQVIARNGERLMELVDDLLLVAQHQSGALTVTPQTIQVSATVLQSVTATHLEAAAKGIVVSVEVPDGLTVMADSIRLGQVLDNLVSNAVKYTQRGGYVVITAAREGEWVRFEVRDNGPGIPEHERSRIFNRFTRARDAEDGGVKGFGLGLPIAHAIVEAHGGHIGVESTPGLGTTFWFTLRAVGDTTAYHI